MCYTSLLYNCGKISWKVAAKKKKESRISLKNKCDFIIDAIRY